MSAKYLAEALKAANAAVAHARSTLWVNVPQARRDEICTAILTRLLEELARKTAQALRNGRASHTVPVHQFARQFRELEPLTNEELCEVARACECEGWRVAFNPSGTDRRAFWLVEKDSEEDSYDDED